MISLTDKQIKIEGFNQISHIDSQSILVIFPLYKIIIEGHNFEVVYFEKREMIIKGEFEKICKTRV